MNKYAICNDSVLPHIYMGWEKNFCTEFFLRIRGHLRINSVYVLYDKKIFEKCYVLRFFYYINKYLSPYIHTFVRT